MAKPKKFRPAIGKRLKTVLAIVFALFALIVVNSVYLVSVTVQGEERQGWFYLWMFLLHLILGLLIVVPTIVFGLVHLRNTYNRPNRQAVRAGWATFLAAILTFISGVALTRVDLGGFRLDLTNDAWRSAAYWAHVARPHGLLDVRLAPTCGRRIKWKIGPSGPVWPRASRIDVHGATKIPGLGTRRSSADYFEPSLPAPLRVTSSTPSADNDEYCAVPRRCVPVWSHSAHRFSSFNNGPYAKSAGHACLPLRSRWQHPSQPFLCRLSRPRSISLGAFDDPDGMIRITRFRRIPLAKPPSPARLPRHQPCEFQLGQCGLHHG